MYLAMSQQDFETVIDDAPRIVAKRLGLGEDLDKLELHDQIRSKDQLAADLLAKFIEVYTEWWQTSCAATQGGPNSKETAKLIQRLINKRGQMRSALMSYLNSQYPEMENEIPPAAVAKHDGMQVGTHGAERINPQSADVIAQAF